MDLVWFSLHFSLFRHMAVLFGCRRCVLQLCQSNLTSCGALSSLSNLSASQRSYFALLRIEPVF